MLAPLDTGYSMTSPNEEIKLRRVDDPEPLPKNMRLMRLGAKLMFVRKDLGGIMWPVSEPEQTKLKKKYGIE